MHSHVPVQIARLREAQKTQFTLIRFLPAVDPQMLGERGAVRESFLTQSAAIGSVSRVCSHVSCHRRALREAPVTDGTAKRLFSAVCSDVRRQVGGLGEGLVASVAFIRFLAAVCPKVCFQRGRPGVGLAADTTQVGFEHALMVVVVVMGVMGVVLRVESPLPHSHPNHHPCRCRPSTCDGDRRRRSRRHGDFVREKLGPLAVETPEAILGVFVQVVVWMSHGVVAGAGVLERISAC